MNDFWILSQNEKILKKTDCLEVYYTGDSYVIKDGFTALATYPTEQRAMEVLKEVDAIKSWKYMAQTDYKRFKDAANTAFTNEGILDLFSKMNTYEFPKE